jgi:hypothetical protein
MTSHRSAAREARLRAAAEAFIAVIAPIEDGLGSALRKPSRAC